MNPILTLCMCSLLFISNTFAQHINDKLTQMELTKNYLSQKNTNSLSQNDISEMIDSASILKTFSDELKNDFIEFESFITSENKKIKNLEIQQSSISSAQLYKNAGSYSGKTIIVEGNVKDIGKDSNRNTYLLLNNEIHCLLSASAKKEILSINLGTNLLVKGTVGLLGNKITLNGCVIIRKQDLTKNSNALSIRAQKFVNSSITKIEIEIKNLISLNIENLRSSGSSHLAKEEWDKALIDFSELKQFSPEYPGIDSLISFSEKSIKYSQGLHSLGDKKYLAAYLILEQLLVPSPFKQSFDMYEEALNNYLVKEIQRAKMEKSLSRYIAVFDTIQSKAKLTPTYYKSFISQNIKEFEVFVLSYYKDNILDYSIVPGGYFKPSLKREQTINTFLICPNKIDYNLLKSYDFVHNSTLRKNSSTNNINIELNQKAFITNWLTLKSLTSLQLEFIEAQGWKSVHEKEVLSDNSNNYKVSVDDLSLCIELEEIIDAKIGERIESDAELVKERVDISVAFRRAQLK